MACRAKALSVQTQPALEPGLDVEAALGRLRAVAPAMVSRGDDDGPYINVDYLSPDLPALWAALRVVLADPVLAGCVIAFCEGERGWDDYLLLHHYDASEPLDVLK